MDSNKYKPQIKLDLAKLPQNLYWQIPVDGAEYLKQTVLRLKPKTILEIGTSSGYSSLWLAEGLLEAGLTDSQIITIESHAGRFEFASENFKKANVGNLIQQLKGHAPEAIPSDLKFELAFFDGTKSQTVSFFDAVWPNLALGGEVLVDNVISHADKMQPFFDHLTNLNIAFEILDIGAGLCRIQNFTS
jgi:caffeoyl-CoA O-methyltransferase